MQMGKKIDSTREIKIERERERERESEREREREILRKMKGENVQSSICGVKIHHKTVT